MLVLRKPKDGAGGADAGAAAAKTQAGLRRL